MFCFNFKM